MSAGNGKGWALFPFVVWGGGNSSLTVAVSLSSGGQFKPQETGM